MVNNSSVRRKVHKLLGGFHRHEPLQLRGGLDARLGEPGEGVLAQGGAVLGVREKEALS